MQLFGINIQTAKARQKAWDAMVAELIVKQHSKAEADLPSKTETEKYVEAYAAGSSKEMLDGMEANKRDAEKYTKIALYLSIPHQALYLLTRVELHHSTPLEWAETGIAWAIAIGVPLLIDQGILMNIRKLTARAASTGTMWTAGLILVPLVAASMFLNFLAPGADVLKWGAASLSLLVAVYQISRMSRPDFKKVGENERKINAEVAEMRNGPADGGQVPQPQPRATRNGRTKAGKAREMAAKSPNLTAGELAAASGVAWGTAKKILAEVAAVAPTSPGPAGSGPAGPSAKEVDQIVNGGAYI